MPTFIDRRDAGQQLARALEAHRNGGASRGADGAVALPAANGRAAHAAGPVDGDTVVVALPRGGVPVAFEVASALRVPLDVLIVRKLGAPGMPEFGLGAVVDGAEPHVVLNEDVHSHFQPPPGYLEAETARQLTEITRRRHAYVGDRPPVAVRGRVVIVVDDGVATGGTARAALQALRQAGARRLILAVPVAAPTALEALRADADEVVCLLAPADFRAVGAYYADFEQTEDAEVIRLLAQAVPDG